MHRTCTLFCWHCIASLHVYTLSSLTESVNKMPFHGGVSRTISSAYARMFTWHKYLTLQPMAHWTVLAISSRRYRVKKYGDKILPWRVPLPTEKLAELISWISCHLTKAVWFVYQKSSRSHYKLKLAIQHNVSIHTVRARCTTISAFSLHCIILLCASFAQSFQVSRQFVAGCFVPCVSASRYYLVPGVLLGVYTVRSSDRPVGPTGLSDWSVRRSYRVNASFDRSDVWFCPTADPTVEACGHYVRLVGPTGQSDDQSRCSVGGIMIS